MIATAARAKAFSPALQYRNAVLTKNRANRRQTAMSKLAMLIKCVNAEVAGEEIKSLRHGEDEQFPVLAYNRGELKK